MDCAPVRPLGPAELLLEASFADMKHAGDGDLSQVYKFAEKGMDVKSDDEQPFPDSWIGTTAPVALGCLTDIATEMLEWYDATEGTEQMWPLIGNLIRRWCNGENPEQNDEWETCEALIRIACREICRFASRLNERLSQLDGKNAMIWSNAFAGYFSVLLDEALQIESLIKSQLVEDKLEAYRISNEESKENGVQQDVRERNLTGRDPLSWIKSVPVLKTRCLATHLLHQAFIAIELDGLLVPLFTEKVASDLLRTLNKSRDLSDAAVGDEDIAHAFQEATYNEWGLDEDLEEEALVNVTKMSQARGSAMFFLTQSAGATNASIQILSALYECEGKKGSEADWDKGSFAAPFLLGLTKDVLVKFIESEARERHRIDPNVWRNTSDSGIKIAVYCTSFASVVVSLLKAMLAFDQTHIEQNKHGFFSTICKLVRVQSEEIRHLVQRILLEKFAPLLGIEDGSG